MRRLILPLAIVLIALPVGFVWGYKAYGPRHPDQSHSMRLRAIASQAQQAGQAETLLVGDSIVELAYIPDLCGRPTLNAGVGGSKLDDVARSLPGLMRMVHPRRVIIAVGVNDTARGGQTSVAAFERRYLRTVAAAKSAGSIVAVATIAPVAINGPLGAAHFDAERIAALNAAIGRVASTTGAKLLPVNSAMSGLDGALPPSSTEDGVHLSHKGYEPWIGAISEACAA